MPLTRNPRVSTVDAAEVEKDMSRQSLDLVQWITGLKRALSVLVS